MERLRGRRGDDGGILLLDRLDKSHPFPREGADQGLFLAAVADRLARGLDPAVNRRVGNDAPTPHRRDQVVLADDPLAIADEAEQQVKDLGLDGNKLAATAQLAPRSIEQMIAEPELHRASPRAG